MASAAKSWLGVPVQVGSDILGALFVEDDDNEGRFSTDDERFLTTLANQAGVALRNLSLLENARQKAKTESMLVEITGKIRRATSIPEILETTAKELGVALNAKRAQIAIQPVSEDTSLETAIPDNRGNGNGSKERE
jgi:GAF domain-containing protein